MTIVWPIEALPAGFPRWPPGLPPMFPSPPENRVPPSPPAGQGRKKKKKNKKTRQRSEDPNRPWQEEQEGETATGYELTERYLTMVRERCPFPNPKRAQRLVSPRDI